MARYLQINARNETELLAQAIADPSGIYVSVDPEKDCYRVSDPERAYRFLAGQAVLAADRQHAVPDDLVPAVLHLGQEFMYDGCDRDAECLAALEASEDGRYLLDSPVSVPIGAIPGMTDRTVRDVLTSTRLEAHAYLRGVTSRMRSVCGDLNRLPFADNAFDGVYSTNAAPAYAVPSAIEEAQRVARAVVERTDSGIATPGIPPAGKVLETGYFGPMLPGP